MNPDAPLSLFLFPCIHPTLRSDIDLPSSVDKALCGDTVRHARSRPCEGRRAIRNSGESFCKMG